MDRLSEHLQYFRVFFKYLKRYRKYSLLFIVFSILSSLLSVISPIIMGRFFDELVFVFTKPGREVVALYWFLLLWLVVQVLSVILKWFSNRLLSVTTLLAEADLNILATKHVLHLPISFHKNVKSGEVNHKTLSAASRFSTTMQSIFSDYISNILMIFLGIIMAAWLFPTLASVLLVSIILYLFSSFYWLHNIVHEQKQGWNEWKSAWSLKSDYINNIFTIKYFNLEEFLSDNVKRAFNRAVDKWRVPLLRWENVNLLQGLFVIFSQIVIFILGMDLISESKISIGDLIAFNAYVLIVFGPLVSFVNKYSHIQNNLVVIADYDKLMQKKEEVYIPRKLCIPEKFIPSVEFNDVYFRYASNEPFVLAGVSFKAEPMQKVALVGGSGGGKTTSVDLISAYIFPNKGKVLVSGKSTKCLPLKYLRKHITIVPQETVLFNDTLKNNLLIAKPDATEEELWQALEKAQLKDFVESLPKKLKSKVGERGVKLSVGQKQRLSIARAFLRNTPILIMDEPTSALDAKTESELQKVFDELFKNKTVFIIAHRLATVKKADKILVFDKGKIVEEGRHEDLIQKEGGVYKELYELQKL